MFRCHDTNMLPCLPPHCAYFRNVRFDVSSTRLQLLASQSFDVGILPATIVECAAIEWIYVAT